jgi:hypothetical protein
VRFSNGQLALSLYCGLKTSPVFMVKNEMADFTVSLENDHLNTKLSNF